MSNKKIWLSPPHLNGDELALLSSALESNWITTQGAFIDDFENDIHGFLQDNRSIVALNSGTSALHIALRLLGIEENDLVICQSFTFVASVNSVRYLNAKPVFIDSERDTWNMCPTLLEEAIIDLQKRNLKPKAIIAVHLYGMPYNVDEIHSLADKYGIPVIEDAAEALGSEYKEKKCGSFGRLAFFSFNGNKIITTSGGGALVCHSEKEKEQAIHLATQANDGGGDYTHSQLGYNYRLSNILAALGRAQMSVLKQRVQARQQNYERYLKHLGSLDGVDFLENPTGYSSNRWLTCILLDSSDSKNQLLEHLNAQDIEARSLWKPMHLQPYYKGFEMYSNGVSDDLFARGLCLPSGSNLSDSDFERVVSAVCDFFGQGLS